MIEDLEAVCVLWQLLDWDGDNEMYADLSSRPRDTVLAEFLGLLTDLAYVAVQNGRDLRSPSQEETAQLLAARDSRIRQVGIRIAGRSAEQPGHGDATKGGGEGS